MGAVKNYRRTRPYKYRAKVSRKCKSKREGKRETIDGGGRREKRVKEATSRMTASVADEEMVKERDEGIGRHFPRTKLR